MSCEARHHDIVARLLSLAGLHDTDADTVMGVGVAKRRRRGELPTPDAAVSVSLHADAQHALAITGHSDQATPSWVAALIDRLHTATDRGSRRALLTMRWLTDGWQDVTPHLTDDDRGWLLTAQRLGITIPPACEVWITRPRPAAVVGRLLPDPAYTATMLADILDALIDCDTISSESVRAVTPLQVLRLLSGGSFPSRTALQQVLRAVLDDAPVVRETVTRLETLYGTQDMVGSFLLGRLIGQAAHTHGRSVDQSGVDGVLTLVAGWIRDVGGPPVDPRSLRDPSPMVVAALIHLVHHRSLDRHLVWSLTALIHIWRTYGRADVIAQVVQALIHTIDRHWDHSFVLLSTIAATVAGAVRPPHGDALIARLSAVDPDTFDTWSTLAAGAIYAAACHREQHVPTVDGKDDLIRHQWRRNHSSDRPSPIPLLAVGQERELLLPVLHTARGTAVWLPMLFDVIDTADMLDMVGGNPQALLSVMTDALSADGRNIDPRIVIRLAASRCGQAVLPHLPTVDTLPVWTRHDRVAPPRLARHLVSPWWPTTLPYLRSWWERAITYVDRSDAWHLLDYPPPLYAMVAPQVAMVRPTVHLTRLAVANQQWETLPESDRQTCLGRLFRRIRKPEHVLPIALQAATNAAIRDITTMLPAMEDLSDRQIRLMCHLIDSDAWGVS